MPLVSFLNLAEKPSPDKGAGALETAPVDEEVGPSDDIAQLEGYCNLTFSSFLI